MLELAKPHTARARPGLADACQSMATVHLVLVGTCRSALLPCYCYILQGRWALEIWGPAVPELNRQTCV